MKTFSQFKEDVDSMKATMKGFADTIVPQMKNFAKSKEVKDLKKFGNFFSCPLKIVYMFSFFSL